MFFIPLFLSNLTTRRIAQKIEYIQTTGSTNETIYNMFKNGTIKEGNVLISEEQTRGKGRRGDKWFSSYGKNLTFSFIISNKNEDLIKKLPLITGISIVEAIKQLTRIDCNLKWPNDILYKAKKLGGVLIEQKKNQFIIGMGINVNEIEFNPSIKNEACSLQSILNYSTQREPLLAFIFNHFEKLLEEDIENITEKWEALCNHINKPIRFSDYSKIFEGEFLGLNKDGEAKIKFNQKEKIIQSGVINY